MTEKNFFEHKRALGGGGSLSCEEWEELLTDALDGQLPVEHREQFEAHGASCAVCAELLAQSRQGREWLQFLGDEPEVPAGMVSRILEKTSGAAVGVPVAQGGPIPAGPHVLGLPVRRVMWDTRMLMTVAMAFFSIALTLNLVGIRLSDVKLADLTPANMETTLTRGFYGAKGSLVRYYDNLRLVYEVESKMRDLRRSERMQQAVPERQVPANPKGNPNKNGGKLAPSTEIRDQGPWTGGPELASVPRSAISGQEGRIEGPETRVQEDRVRRSAVNVQNTGLEIPGSGKSEVGEAMVVFWEVGQEGGLA